MLLRPSSLTLPHALVRVALTARLARHELKPIASRELFGKFAYVLGELPRRRLAKTFCA